MKHKNLALELLKRLMNDEIKARKQTNLVQSKKFSEMLDSTIKRYQNNLISSAQVIQELIDMAKEIKEADRRGEELGLDFRDYAFYSALEVSDSAVKILGDDVLRHIAQDLVETVRNNTTIDWTIRENVKARMRVAVKRILRKHGYPPDMEAKATDTVLEQARLMADQISGPYSQNIYPLPSEGFSHEIAAEEDLFLFAMKVKERYVYIEPKASGIFIHFLSISK